LVNEVALADLYLDSTTEGNAADLARSIEKGYPVGRAATVELRNQHAVYAATW
jgi:surfeit locus 1 family protein